jgi:hypothetical protein
MRQASGPHTTRNHPPVIPDNRVGRIFHQRPILVQRILGGLPHLGPPRSCCDAGTGSAEPNELAQIIGLRYALYERLGIRPVRISKYLSQLAVGQIGNKADYCVHNATIIFPLQIAAHNKHKHLLQRDTSLVVVLTFVVLLLAAFLANTCVQILKYHGYVYTTSSFGKPIQRIQARRG